MFQCFFSGKYFRSRARLRRSKPFVFAVAMSAPQVFSVAEMDDESSDSRRRDERTRSNRRWVASSDAREVKSSAVRRTRSASTGAQPSHQVFCVELRRSAFFGELTGVAASPKPAKPAMRASSVPPSVPVCEKKEAPVSELEWKLMLMS